MVAETQSDKYDRAAPRWGDKMRLLGYFDAYLGFLSEPGSRPDAATSCILDLGAGTGAFAEAWVAVFGVPRELVLLDSSAAMLDRAKAALARRNVSPTLLCRDFSDISDVGNMDEVLAAHVIEHMPDPAKGLTLIRAMLRPGGRLRLVASKPHWCNAIIWFQWRHRTFTPSAIRSLATETGYEIESEYAFPTGPPSRTSRGYVLRAQGQ